MEQKQNAKPHTIEDPIEKLWKSNPKIPFMQSKDILRFGYTEGQKSAVSAKTSHLQPQEKPVTKDDFDTCFTGTTKEMIRHAEKEMAKATVVPKQPKVKVEVVHASKLDIEQSKFDLINEILGHIEENKDLMLTYSYLRTRRQESVSKIKQLKR